MSRHRRLIDQAAKRYADFHGEEAEVIDEYHLPDNDQVAYRLGDEVEAIAYNARRDGKRHSYIHEIKKGFRPHLDVSADGRTFYLTGGGIEATNHGIEDLNMPGLLVVNPHKPGDKPKYKVLNMAKAKRNSKGQFVKASRAAPKRRRKNPIRRRAHAAAAPKARRSSRRGAPRSNSPSIIYMEPKVSRKKNPIKRRRRNPIGFGGRGRGLDLVQLGVAGLTQATGAIVVSALWPILGRFLPDSWKSGPPAAVGKILLGIALGIAITMFGKHNAKVQQFAQNFAEGTVTLAMVEWLKGALPSTITMGQVRDGMGYTTASNVLIDDMGQVRDMGAITYADGLAYGEMGRATQYQTY